MLANLVVRTKSARSESSRFGITFLEHTAKLNEKILRSWIFVSSITGRIMTLWPKIQCGK